ncbi:TIGR02253 family HAD-type hydrolase [Candidatus Micrarchaeota archaeon]|nr:TIGR02253 family HAD-type hydrolase [Candidatus Micrarchaeota archaeon]
MLKILHLVMVKQVFIDIDDTLFPTAEFSELARRKAIRAMIEVGLDGGQEKLYKKLVRIIKKKGSNYDHHFDDLLEELGVKEPAKYVAAAVGAYHAAKGAIQPYPEVPRTLLKLREQGYMLHVATNGTAVKQWDKLILLKVHLFFEKVFVSEKMGMEKNVEFFRKALRKLGASPGECVMVGDKPEIDTIPPKKLGMKTIRAMMGGRHTKKPGKADLEMKNFAELPELLAKLD